MKSKQYATLAALLAASLMGSSALAAPAKKAAAAKTKTAQVDEDEDDEPAEVQPAPAPAEPAPAPAPEPKPLPAPPTDSAPAPTTPAVAPPETGKEIPGDGLGISTPVMEDDASRDLQVRPYALVAGGVKADFVHDKPEEDRQNRVSTFALGRLGLRARYKDWIAAESEFMASGGIGLHGTSAYEGQAAMQVRQQLIRLGKNAWRVEVGRLIDPASVDFFSAHVADTFLQDTATRDPLLYSGFNLGNGIRGAYEIFPGLSLGLTLNAGNPVSTTASLMIGGAFPPFERFYTQPYQAVNQGPNHFPDDTFHIYVLTPSILIDTKDVDVKLAVQGFDVNTNMNRSNDDHIRGYNARGTARLKLFDGTVIPFASGAFTQNDTMQPNDLSRRASERYRAIDLGGGVDANWARRFRCSYDCADGVGVQYQQVQHQIGSGLVTTLRFVNVGTTYWLAPNVALGARFAMWFQEIAGQASVGERSAIASLRFVMP